MKCDCGEEATFSIPREVCGSCWFDWWTDRYVEESLCTPKEYEKMKQDFLAEEKGGNRGNA